MSQNPDLKKIADAIKDVNEEKLEHMVATVIQQLTNMFVDNKISGCYFQDSNRYNTDRLFPKQSLRIDVRIADNNPSNIPLGIFPPEEGKNYYNSLKISSGTKKELQEMNDDLFIINQHILTPDSKLKMSAAYLCAANFSNPETFDIPALPIEFAKQIYIRMPEIDETADTPATATRAVKNK